MGIKIKAGVHNSFEFVKKDAKTGEVLGKYKAENIILDNFWGVFLSSNSLDYMKYIHFGSGTAEPQATDVKLTSWVGYKTAPGGGADGTAYNLSNFHDNGVIVIRKTVRLEDTEYNGESISEVGYSNSTSGTSGLLTKAIVKDMNGNPISIEKREGEVIDIFATFFIDFGRSFNDGEVVVTHQRLLYVANTQYHLVHRMLALGVSMSHSYYNAAYFSGRVFENTGDYNVGRLDAYLPGTVGRVVDVQNRTLTLTIPDVLAGDGNTLGGIRGMHVGGLGIKLPCTGFTQPVITKEEVGVGDGEIKDFQTKFGFIKNNGTAKVYVNDVEVAATIDFNQMPAVSDIAPHMDLVDYSKLDDNGMCVTPVVIGTGEANNTTGYVILENPLYQKVGIDSIYGSNILVYFSNDLTNWEGGISCGSSLGTTAIPVQYKNYRYIKAIGNPLQYIYNHSRVASLNSTDAAALTNIHLSTAPAEGDVVKVTYQPDCIAKDETKVIQNVSVVISFNEYTP